MSIPIAQRFFEDGPCPACGHFGTRSKPSWCYSYPGDRKFWCGREGSYKGMAGEPVGGGWEHWYLTLEEARAAGHVKPREAARGHARPPVRRAERVERKVDVERFAEADRLARRRVTNAQVGELADLLGVTRRSLRRLHVGWVDAAWGEKVDRDTGEARRARVLPGLNTICKGAGAFTFPTHDGDWRLRGIRLRAWPPTKDHPSGFKYGADDMDGSALHLPDGLLDARGGDLLLPEGASGTAALLSLRFNAIGRPSCSAGVAYLRRAIARIRPARAFVIGDRDEPDSRGRRAGQESAPIVAAAVCGAWPGLEVCTHLIPPEGIKDSRDWLADGLDRDELMGALDQAAADADRGWRHAG